MDCYRTFEALAPAIRGVHIDRENFGSEASNYNATYGYLQHPKPRHQDVRFEYHDAGAMERFGIDPTKPVPLGVTVTADPYGYPLDGFTTGYTIKLPPPADLVAAQNTPKSFNIPSVVARSDGSDFVPAIPGDRPIDYVNQRYANQAGTPGGPPAWTYGPESGLRARTLNTVAPAIGANAAALSTAMQHAGLNAQQTANVLKALTAIPMG